MLWLLRLSGPTAAAWARRGFAFVEFGSKQEAAAALEATAGIHLYGRRLVVEWAKADDGAGGVRNPVYGSS